MDLVKTKTAIDGKLLSAFLRGCIQKGGEQELIYLWSSSIVYGTVTPCP